MSFLDTDFDGEFSAMRDLYIKNSEGFILLYSVTSLGTFNAVVEMKEHFMRVKDCEDVPIVLVGTVRKEDKTPRQVTVEQGQEMARQLECQFFEVDLDDSDRVEAIFKALLPLIFTWRKMQEKKNKKDRDCVVM